MKKTLLFLLNNKETILIFLSISIFAIGKGKTYLNFTGIIKKYFKSFIGKNKGSVSALIITPLFLSIAIGIKKPIDDNLLELITVTISILMSLFFTYLSFFQGYYEKVVSEIQDYNIKSLKSIFVKETKIIASYEILLSIIILVLCFSFELFPKEIELIFRIILYFLFFHMLMNLFVLLKRYENSSY